MTTATISQASTSPFSQRRMAAGWSFLTTRARPSWASSDLPVTMWLGTFSKALAVAHHSDLDPVNLLVCKLTHNQTADIEESFRAMVTLLSSRSYVLDPSNDELLSHAKQSGVTASDQPNYQTELVIDDDLGQDRALIEEIEVLCWKARSEAFESGVGSDFARELAHRVSEQGDDFLRVFQELASYRGLNSSIVAEALRVLGQLRDPKTTDSRRFFLITCLFHPAPEVRDAAGLGLAALGDNRAALAVRRAAQREPLHELRTELSRVADFLGA